MRNKSRAVHLQHQDVVYPPDFFALNELHPALVRERIDWKTNTISLVYMPCLGEELDVERMAFNLGGTLRMHIARNELMAARVNPLPLFGVLAKVGVGLLWAPIHRVEILR